MAMAYEMDIVPVHRTCHAFASTLTGLWSDTMRYWAKSTPAVFLLLFLLAFLTSSGNTQNQTASSPAAGTEGQTQTKGKVVYVCACLKTNDWWSTTDTKKDGPRPCGTDRAAPLKAVPKDIAWPKKTREALEK